MGRPGNFKKEEGTKSKIVRKQIEAFLNQPYAQGTLLWQPSPPSHHVRIETIPDVLHVKGKWPGRQYHLDHILMIEKPLAPKI
jgi:hypothetical protein